MPWSSHENNMADISHYNTFDFSIYVQVRYEKFVWKHTETIEYVKN